MILHVSKTKKSLRSQTDLRDEYNPWYHPDYFQKEVTSDSSKSYPCNGGNRVSLLSRRAVHKTDSGIRPLHSSAPAHTSRRLSGASKRSEFSVIVFALCVFVI